ncbi:uncharacterized protein LOC133789303 isoform X2 [Humulus lupulus]|nr:uncharacterized protein LOC133789303 isoform X2 [Humulus lupulus]
MDSDLEAVLFSDEGAQKSKRPGGSRKSDRPSKVPRRTEKTPTAQTAASTAEDPNAQVDASVSIAPVTLPPAATLLTIGRPPKKPSISKALLPSARPHVEEFVLDGTAGIHGAILGSDVLSRVGQSFSGFGADHWDFVNKAPDCNALYDKSIELTAAAFVISAQLNYKLTNEVHTSMSLAQESRDLQLKTADELKDSKAELEKVKTRLAELEKANAKLEEEKAATFEIMESEKARILNEFKENKEKAVDQAMYKI